MDTGARPRRDTTTTNASSELSSENEFDSALFQRKPLSSRKARASQLLTDRIQEEEREGDDIDDDGAESDTTLSSAFIGSVDSGSILSRAHMGDSLLSKLPGMPRGSTGRTNRNSGRRSRGNPTLLQALPPPRPISMVAPVSLLTQAFKVNSKAHEIPFAKFATLSGKGDANPLYIKIWAPGSKSPDKPFELLLQRNAEGGTVTVAEAIGFALWTYGEEKLEPRIDGDKATVNRWNFRMVDDGDVEYDFPALGRTMPIADFASNNNRGGRARSRDKPWDEFALVEASNKEFADNELVTPKYRKEAPSVNETARAAHLAVPSALASHVNTPAPSFMSYRNPITGPSFSLTRKDGAPMDAPATSYRHATPRTGLSKTLNIHFTDENVVSRTTLIEVTTDTYIAEVFAQICKRLNVEKAQYILRVSGTSTLVPQDRTVEALGDRTDLDLSRRRFVGDGAFGLSGSPGSSSPNAPLLIAPGMPKKGKGAKVTFTTSPAAILGPKDSLLLNPSGGYSKRFNVIRRQAMSFATSSTRILMLEHEFMHILPGEGNAGKTTTFPYSHVVGCKVSRKHRKSIRMTAFKGTESKSYDFECGTREEAAEAVGEIWRGMEAFKPERGLEL
jgi:hypothetical protein